jgi:hypothetical protein
VGDLVAFPSGEVQRHNSAEAKQARKALYLEWLIVPKDQRDPQTKSEMAERLGCTLQTLLTYEREPEFTNEVSRRLGAAFRVDRLTDIFEALVLTALTPCPQQVAAARTLLEWFDKGQRATPNSDLSEMTEDQLRAALARPA